MPDPVLPSEQPADGDDFPDDCSVIPPAKKRSRSANAGRDDVNRALASACHAFTAAVNNSSLSVKERLGTTVLLTKVLHAKDMDQLSSAIYEAGKVIDDLPVIAAKSLNQCITNKSLSLL